MLHSYSTPVGWVCHYGNRFANAVMLLFLVPSVLVIVPLSFNKGSFLVYPLEGSSLTRYRGVFGSYGGMHSLRDCLIVVPEATVIAVVLGELTSVELVRTDSPGSTLSATFSSRL